MQDAVAAIESALGELLQARQALPDDTATELDALISQTRALIEALRASPDGLSASPAPESSPAPD